MKGDGETMGLVANSLNQEQRRIVLRQDDGLRPLAREDHFFLLRDANRHQVSQPDGLECVVGCGQLPAAAVDQNQVRERPAVLEDLR